jgi:hypothetical protein
VIQHHGEAAAYVFVLRSSAAPGAADTPRRRSRQRR